uniref:Uncharacterized protein n=1 Tax=Oryza meridionalis TaxID=40149 RepID=A0A0E0ELA7_9ORYZ
MNKERGRYDGDRSSTTNGNASFPVADDGEEGEEDEMELSALWRVMGGGEAGKGVGELGVATFGTCIGAVQTTVGSVFSRSRSLSRLAGEVEHQVLRWSELVRLKVGPERRGQFNAHYGEAGFSRLRIIIGLSFN